MLESTAPQQYK